MSQLSKIKDSYLFWQIMSVLFKRPACSCRASAPLAELAKFMVGQANRRPYNWFDCANNSRVADQAAT